MLTLTSLLIYALWRYAARARLIRPDFEDQEIRILSRERGRRTPGSGRPARGLRRFDSGPD